MHHKTKISFQKVLTNHKMAKIIGPCPLENHLKQLQIPTIFVDGGLSHYRNLKKISSDLDYISLGDNDSFPKLKAKKLKLDILLDANKDYSDFKAALDLVGKHGDHLFLDGLFPPLKKEKRIDHYLANLGECFHWSKKNSGFIQLNSTTFLFPKGKHLIEYSGQFSLFTLFSNQIKLIGDCQFQLKKWNKLNALSSHGISNLGFGQIQLESTLPVLFIGENRS